MHLSSFQICPFRQLASGGGITKMSLSICSPCNAVSISTAWMSQLFLITNPNTVWKGVLWAEMWFF